LYQQKRRKYNPKNPKEMKRFKLHGNTAYWNGLKLKSINLSNLKEEETSPIPNGKRMYVNVVDNLYRDESARKEVLVGEVSDTDKEYILNKLNTSVPNFLLTLDGKVVGYANLHHRHGTKDAEDTTDTETPIDIFGGIVDGELALLIIPATATTPARKKEEPKEDYYVRQEVTISVYQKVSATNEKEAREKATDLLAKVETFLDENFSGDGNSYVTSDYYTEVRK
jgi:hypothetical protein